MNANYWMKKTAAMTVSRRQAIAATGMGALGAAFLAACGGSNKSSDAGSSGKSLVSSPTDSTAKATKGGTLPGSLANDVINWYTETNPPDATAATHAYSRLVKFEAVKYPKKATENVVPDAAASWETSPDGLTYTYKLRPNQKFDPRPPTSSRVMTTADVKYTWERFIKLNPSRTVLANALDKTAPVSSFETPDPTTIVVKLAFPYAPLNSLFAYYRHMPILPVEADGKFNIGTDMRGSGAWRLKTYERSARIEYEKNTDWYDADKVFLDTQSMPIVSEYATGLAQFRAGNIATYAVLGDDILSVKRDLPQVNMLAQEDHLRDGRKVGFGWLPDSPFRDERVRQAISMLIDRDAFIETFFNTKQFSDAGLDAPKRWNSHVLAGEDGFWLDPQSEKDFGANFKYFKHDPAEAKKMLAAAGFTSAIKTDWTYPTNGFGAQFNREAEVLSQMWQEHGDFSFKVNNPDYQTEWRTKYDRSAGKYNGLTYGVALSYPDLDGWFQNRLRSGQERTGHDPDATLDGMIDQQRKEGDLAKRTAQIQEIQRYSAKAMYVVFNPGDALSFDMAWPWLGNFRVYRSWAGGSASNETEIYYWIDQSQKKS